METTDYMHGVCLEWIVDHSEDKLPPNINAMLESSFQAKEGKYDFVFLFEKYFRNFLKNTLEYVYLSAKFGKLSFSQ